MTDYFYKSLGATVDFSGHYTTHALGPFDSVHLHRCSFLAGPVYAFHAPEVTPFVQALFGGIVQGSSEPYRSFMWVIGGGVDANLSRRIAIRPAQFDYERHSVPSFGTATDWTNGFRYSAGVVLKF